jgi:hypothetical protein
MNYNLNTGYGQALATALHGSVPVTGKLFVVGDSSTANLDMLKEMFVPDPDGKVRFFATVDAAIGQCTANAGDVILVAPGHVETISAATSVVVDVAGISIIGMGNGSNRPEFNYSATAGSLEIDAANVRLSNFILRADVSAVVVGVNVDADNFQMDNCHMTYNATGDDFVTMLDCDAVDGMKLIDNVFEAEEGAAGCDEAIRLDDTHNLVMTGNHITGDFTDGAVIGEGALGNNWLIANNFVRNVDTTAGFVFDINVASTGILANNVCATLFATAPETALDPGSLLSVENYVCNAVDESGALVPTTVST